MKRSWLAIAGLLLTSVAFTAPSVERSPDWVPYAPEAFARAEQDERHVFLYLEAVWCHWCHVMQRETFTDPAVLDRLDSHYVAVRADHDAQPALANRYRAWGWPALIFLTADGTEIVKRAGYIAPEPFARLLDAIVADPSPEAGPAAAPAPQTASSDLSKTVRDTLITRHDSSYDWALGGLDQMQKFVDSDSTEYALVRARSGDAREARRARLTLDAASALIDPVWGGAYQYSTHGDWQHAHYEKIMSTQARMLRLYSHAYALWGTPRDRRRIDAIAGYLLGFLRDDAGAFYTSQDADVVPGQKAGDYFQLDDAQRRAIGMPRIDPNRYAQHNGWAIEALLAAADATGDVTYREAARDAAQWIAANRLQPDGGFRHGEASNGPRYFGDNLAMSRALLALYRSTAERHWLDTAVAAGDFIIGAFGLGPAGFVGATGGTGPLAPVPDLDENIAAARHFNLLWQVTGAPRFAQASDRAMRYLAVPDVALSRSVESGILLADAERRRDPTHLTVVTPRDSATGEQLFGAALSTPGRYTRVEWWDRSRGPLPRMDVEYPAFDRPAGYVCGDGRCSAPSFNSDTYRARIEALLLDDAATPQ